MNTPQLLTYGETCQRKGYWGAFWALGRMNPSQMVAEAMRKALTSLEAPDWGELAGSEVLQLAEDRGLDTTTDRIYESAMNHAALADILTAVTRKPADPPWLVPEPLQNWKGDCLLSPDGDYLRRIVLVSHWNHERHYSECRSWFSLGEIAHYKLPMQMLVFIIGQQIDGKRRSPWTTGFLHPANHQLRFRKKSRSTSEVFKDTWERILREDHAEIERDKWLQAMLTDDVLTEVMFRVDIPVPEESHRKKIVAMAERKLERLYALKKTPEPNLSTCDWPVPCVFKRCCHVVPEREPSENMGYVHIKV